MKREQNRVVELAGLRFGEGTPKICVPLVARTLSGLKREAEAACGLPADLCEWRLDHFTNDFREGIALLRQALPKKPILCTLRTRRDGGLFDGDAEEYEQYLLALLKQGGFQFLDIEISCGENRVRSLAEKARRQGIGVVVSSHDFEKTPEAEQLYSTLVNMKALGADLPKLAVMPHVAEDVLALFTATLRAFREIGPVITMAMGALGAPSRVLGQLVGSCLTFGAGQSVSAPGQLGAVDLKLFLTKLNSELEQLESGAAHNEK